MYIPIPDLINKFGMKATGVIHIGAHYGEEYPAYNQHGILPIIMIEPCKPAFDILMDLFQDNDNITLFKYACGAARAKMEMNIETANQGQSNSLLKPKLHLQQFPSIEFKSKEMVDVIPLDDLPFVREHYNFLNMDCQGYELEILKGAQETLKHIHYIYTEINTDEVYEGCAKVDQLDAFLSDFVRVETKMADINWGDAFYVRKGI